MIRRVATIVLGVLFTVAGELTAQGITGFSPASAARQVKLEVRLRAVPDTATSREYTRALAARPHVAGSPAQKATADILPYSDAALGAYLGQLIGRAVRAPDEAALATELAALRDAARRLEVAGQRFEALRDSVLGAAKGNDPRFGRANAILRTVEQTLTRSEGLVGRPFIRNLVFGSDRDNSYANIPFPGVVEALRDHDLPHARVELGDLTSRILTASSAVDAARAALRAAPARR